MGAQCVAACQYLGYRGVGTFEFLYEDGKFYFIEMNTRLQVEHTVTEMVTGIDIVAQQLRIAQGEVLAFGQDDVVQRGFAMECRINAEDPLTFIPNPGRVTRWDVPGGFGVRFDSHIRNGDTVSPYYDSMIGKLVTQGETRAEAISRMKVALAELAVQGIQTNVPMHLDLLGDDSVQAGGVDNHFLERWLASRASV